MPSKKKNQNQEKTETDKLTNKAKSPCLQYPEDRNRQIDKQG